MARFNTVGQARFYVEHLGADFDDYELEHNNYKTALAEAESALRFYGRVQVLDRAFLPNFIFGRDDMVVVLGQDGLVANTMKYLTQQRVIAVNPDPVRWDGVLLPFEVEDLDALVPEIFAGLRTFREITMARAELNTGQVLHAVNDLFVGQKSHVSARYSISIGGEAEQQSSSGIIVSTGLGSTGWLKSCLAGAREIVGAMGFHAGTDALLDGFGWESDYLFYTVREPFPSRTSGATMVFGKVTAQNPMNLVSQMPENGVIFSDGIEADFLEFNSGTRAVISVAEKRGCLVV